MTRPAPIRRRRVAVTASLALATTLSACSSDDPEPTPTTTAPTTTTVTTTTAPTTTAPASPTTTATAAPTTTGPGGTATPPGSDSAALAQMLPLGFPVPPELTIIGEPTSTDDNANVAFLVPSGEAAFEFYRTELAAEGYEFLPGTSNAYSTEVASGAILARGNGFDVNLLVVEDDVEITLTRTR